MMVLMVICMASRSLCVGRPKGCHGMLGPKARLKGTRAKGRGGDVCALITAPASASAPDASLSHTLPSFNRPSVVNRQAGVAELLWLSNYGVDGVDIQAMLCLLHRVHGDEGAKRGWGWKAYRGTR